MNCPAGAHEGSHGRSPWIRWSQEFRPEGADGVTRMPGTYSQLLLHIAFSTKGRARLITPELEPRLHAFMGGIVRDERGTALCIGGMPDHVHLLVRWRTDETIAHLLRNVKA